jgi:hypothetical protein
MSYLENPSFETPYEDWTSVNHAAAVQQGYDFGSAIAKSGNVTFYFRTSMPDGSVAQDVSVLTPSVTCFAWVRARTGFVDGALTLWRLATGHESTARFRVGAEWLLLTNTMGLRYGGSLVQQLIRVEFYLSTVNADLLIDSANLF